MVGLRKGFKHPDVDTTDTTQCYELYFVRMEIWISQADKEHAENLRCPNSTQSVHNLDGLDKEEIPRAQGRQIQGEDEVPKDNERRDHAESSGNEV